MSPLDRERWERLEALMDEALELDESRRAQFLQDLGALEPTLRADLEALLRADESTGDFLEAPLAALAAPLLETPAATSPPLEAPPDPVGQAPPVRIGPYRILAEAGKGGMGTVYLAERDDDQFRKRVAVKVIREELALPQLVTRFLDERQILASLQHPGIAGLLDGGVTSTGAPYYVMEHVDGTRIDRWCDGRRLGVSARVRLFLRVCEAVAYAHRNLVVHRDLKPANILVLEDGQVKLLDFGIARLLSPTGEAGSTTVVGLRMFTPEYASPEQLAGGVVTTASDVYSLGVLLHELLAGCLPASPAITERRSGARIGGADPPSASALVLQAPERSRSTGTPARASEDISRDRGMTPRALSRRLRGDLDAILRKALAAAPEGRFATVEELAADLQRHLAGEPVGARRGSSWYIARRLVGRHRALAAAALAAVLLGSGFTLAYTRAVTREREAALSAAARSEQVATFLIELFAQSDPLGDSGGPRDVTEFLAVGANRLRHELVDQPELRASMLRTVGKVYENLGAYQEAEALFEEALSLRAGASDGAGPELAESIQDLGGLRRRRGDFPAADSLLREAVVRWEAGSAPERLANALDEMASLRRAQGELDAADSLFRAALGLRLPVLGPDHPRVGNSLTHLGILARQRNDLASAQDYHQKALAAMRAHYGQEHVYVAESLKNLAMVLHADGKLAQARATYEEALDMQLRLLGRAHPSVGSTRNSLGALLRALGEHAAAVEQYDFALELQRRALGSEHPSVATSVTNLASVVSDMGDQVRAEALAREGLETRLRLLPANHPSVAQSFNVLGLVYRRAEEWDRADEALGRAEAIYLARLGADHPFVAINRTSLGHVALGRGDARAAGARFREALDIFRRVGQAGHVDAARALAGLGEATLMDGRPEEAEAYLREALAIRRSELPADHPDVAATESHLEAAMRAQGLGAGADSALDT